MLKQKIMALLLTAVLVVTTVLGTAQQAQAAVALSAQQIDILYGLLASGGVIAAKEGTDTKKRQTITDWAKSAPDASTWTATKYLDGWTADDSGNYHYTSSGDTTLQDVKSWLAGLRTSVVDWINSNGLSVSVNPPTAWTIYRDSWKYRAATVANSYQTIASGTGIYALVARANKAVGTYDATVVGVTPDGYLLALKVLDSNGVLVNTPYSKNYNGTGHHGDYVGTECRLRLSSYGSKTSTIDSKGYSSFSVSVVDSNGTVLTGVSMGNSYYEDTDAAVVGWGGGNAIGVGRVDVSGVLAAVANELGTIDTGIDCDTWSDTLGRDMVDDNKDVVILGGQDLAGYDTVDSVRSGYVTGVDWDNTVNPDVPVPDDIPGKLDSIIDWLKGLPALLGTALIGDGNIDWSKLQGIELKSVFPFCIPWDLAACFKSFNVDAIEPVFVFDFSDTALKSAGTVQIDLSRFSELIPIVRYFVYGFFVVGLIVKTRDLIRG